MSLFKKNKILLAIFVSVVIINIISADNTVGLILNDETKSFNGYCLFAPAETKTAYLIDNEGNLVNKWESEFDPALSMYLLEDGSLLRAAKVVESGQNLMGGFQKFSWEGDLIWQYYYGSQHHDVEPMPNGNVLVVVNDRKTQTAAVQAGRDPGLIDDGNIRSLSIIEVKQTGKYSGDIIWRWNIWDHLVQDFDSSKHNLGTVADHPELMDINFVLDGDQNWLHTNSVSYDEEFDQILVSNRRTNEIWVIDHSTTTEQAATHEDGNSEKGGDLLYRWGNPQAYKAGTAADQKLFGQHDAYRVESSIPGAGNIVIFNNGWSERGYSSIDEIMPPVDENGIYSLVNGTAYEPATSSWSYTATQEIDFNSERYGGSQRLPNGNTLICNSVNGEFIEVTNSKEIVWKYVNPVTKNGILQQGETAEKYSAFRCYKYPLDYPAFYEKNITPGEPIETYIVGVKEDNDNIKDFKLYDNFPNPFNPTTNIEFSLNERNFVNITIYDLVGNTIKTLFNDIMEPGLNTLTWDSHDNNGSLVSTGIYFYSLQSGYQSQTKKMMLLR